MKETHTHNSPELHEALLKAYARQRYAQPSELTQAAAWQFAAKSVLPANPDVPFERHLIDTTVKLCQKQGIRNIPPVFILDSKLLNAASVQGKQVIITTGLLKHMSTEQVEAVIGHELSHHRHSLRDTIAQAGLAYLGGHAGSYVGQLALNGIRRKLHIPNAALSLLGTTSLAAAPVWLGTMLAITPYRHFMELEADKEGALLTTPEHMKGALKVLDKESERIRQESELKPKDWKRRIVKGLLFPFSSHPSTDRRLARLEALEHKVQTHAERLIERDNARELDTTPSVS